jgi:hypothetical protein
MPWMMLNYLEMPNSYNTVHIKFQWSVIRSSGKVINFTAETLRVSDEFCISKFPITLIQYLNN